MKRINVYFEDDDFEMLVKMKDGLTWKDFILTLLNKEDKE